MKTVVFGDIHGSQLWKSIMDKENPDKVIFLGDYFDPYDKELIPDMYKNFREIIKLKIDKMGNDCIILIGNHDYHYMEFNSDYSSRYSNETQLNMGFNLKSYYNDNIMKFSHFENGIWFTHAGISKYWLNEIAGINDNELSEDELNKLNPNLYAFNNYTSYFDTYGDSKSQSPIWIRPQALLNNAIEGTQIVGHTRFKAPTRIRDYEEKYPDIYFIDTIEVGGYLVIEDNKIECKNV